MRAFCRFPFLAAAFVVPLLAQQTSLFEYDHSVPFQYQEQLIRRDGSIEVLSAHFQNPKGGNVPMLVVRPTGKGRFAGIVYQHGGGQSLVTYLSEAEVLARAGAISLLLDAPGPGNGSRKPESEQSAAEFRDSYAEIVICYRRAIDYLQTLNNVDPARIGFVGHSYGGIMGGALVTVEAASPKLRLDRRRGTIHPAYRRDADRLLE
ncbi:MAG TPA: alpha/beta fold hydrolase [Bryobacteraceae bacterium]|nr:alpha/beta fold hydrolase [Bryobacteraceae bacterium]